MHLLVPQTLEGAGAVWSFKSAKDGVRNRSAGCTHTEAQFSKCQAKSAPPAVFTILAVGTDFLCFTALQPGCSLIVLWPLLRPKRKGCDSLVYGV